MVTLSFSVIYQTSTVEPYNGTLTGSLMILPLLFYVLYIYIQYQEVRDHKPEEEEKQQSTALASWGETGYLRINGYHWSGDADQSRYQTR